MKKKTWGWGGKKPSKKQIEAMCKNLEGRSVLDYVDWSNAPNWDDVRRDLQNQVKYADGHTPEWWVAPPKH